MAWSAPVEFIENEVKKETCMDQGMGKEREVYGKRISDVGA